MSLRQYEYALIVAQEGSVTAAADRLLVAQPSVSQQIKSLERDLGVRLFARTPRGLAPTVAGRAFLKEAEVAVAAARRARVMAQAGSQDLTGELLVATQLGLGVPQLARALATLRRSHPLLRVTLYEDPTLADLERLVRLGALDLALVDHVPPGCGYDAHVLGQEPYAAVLPRDHPLLDSDGVTLDELVAQPWVGFTEDSALNARTAEHLNARGLRVSPVARASQIGATLRLVADGLGVTIVPNSGVPEGYVALARPIAPMMWEPVLLAARPEPGPAESVLIDLLRQQQWPAGPVPGIQGGEPGLGPHTAPKDKVTS
ncbi:LysR family transcriptional regulator [Promicromonospora sp. AC04]|uniref:LysR family transcriptional regulator n=1 Tax=Promicromonospora sp. AC04 TaxID=2135723 RepID=UPI000D3944DA|nr:LysR family transcriptional regulator [Promicromonospora sp. AC04]PUB20799.1 LysR family transcriptional regulator [Promicromonospora sp. AC04]